MTSKVTVKTKRIAYPRKVVIRAGILEPGESHEGGMTVGELAETHEFGEGRIPPRAPIRVFADTKGPEISTLATKLFQQAAQSDHGMSAFQRAAGLTAVKASAEIKNTITEGLQPPISPVTEAIKERKGYSPPYTPLIETGVLKNSYDADAEVIP